MGAGLKPNYILVAFSRNAKCRPEQRAGRQRYGRNTFLGRGQEMLGFSLPNSLAALFWLLHFG